MHLHACQLCVKSFVRAWVLKQWTINLSNLSFSICYCIANVKMGPATNDQPQTLHKPDTVVRQNIGSTDSSIPCCFTVYRYAGMMWIPLQNLASLRIGIGIIVNNSRGQSSILHTTLTTFIGRRHGHIGMWWLAPVLWAFTQGQRREHFSIYHRTFHQWNIMKVHHLLIHDDLRQNEHENYSDTDVCIEFPDCSNIALLLGHGVNGLAFFSKCDRRANDEHGTPCVWSVSTGRPWTTRASLGVNQRLCRLLMMMLADETRVLRTWVLGKDMGYNYDHYDWKCYLYVCWGIVFSFSM